MIGLNKIGLNQVQLNRLRLNAPFPAYGKMAGGGGSGDGFPVLPGDVTRWHFGGLTNEMMAAMDDPRIEDADHKGRFLSFKNFAWGGMSGVGGYADNWNSSADWAINSYWVNSHTDHKLQFIKASSVVQARSNNIYNAENVYKNILNVNGLTEAVNKGSVEALRINAVDPIISKAIKTFSFDTDGVIQISFDDVLQDYYIAYFLSGNNTNDIDITIEQLPLYPGFILGDGVDDFAVTEKELNFEDTYTVYTAFIPFQDDPARNMILCGKNDTKDFAINYSGTHLNFKPSTGVNLAVRIDQFALLVCKRNKDITTIINLSTGESRSLKSVEFISNPGLYYLWRNVFATFHAKAAIAGQIIDNGHFTTDEEDENILNWHKKQYPWLFPNQAWTVTGKTNEDEDRATIPNITGNGNDLVLSNFGFAEGSGYGLYKTPFELYPSVQHSSKYSLSFSKFALGDHNLIIAPKQNDLSYDIKVKVTGLKDGVKFKWGWIGTTGYIDITTDGIHMLNKPASQIRQLIVEFAEDFDPDHVVTIEQIPEYEGYLITDGVDDEIISAKLIQFADKFTIVGDWKFMEDRNDKAGLLKANQIYIYNATTGMRIYLKQGSRHYSFSCKKINALTSDGWVYDEKWDKYKVYPIGSDIDISSRLFLGFYSSNFTKIALKNLGIYNDQLLSKDDCIKAYNYLQTLKAK